MPPLSGAGKLSGAKTREAALVSQGDPPDFEPCTAPLTELEPIDTGPKTRTGSRDFPIIFAIAAKNKRPSAGFELEEPA